MRFLCLSRDCLVVCPTKAPPGRLLEPHKSSPAQNMVGFGSGAGFGAAVGTMVKEQPKAGPSSAKASASKGGAKGAKGKSAKSKSSNIAKALSGQGELKNDEDDDEDLADASSAAATPADSGEASATAAAVSAASATAPATAPAHVVAAPAAALAAAPEPEPEPPANNGKVKVRYNHYNRDFDVVGGKLQWEHVDDEYAIGFVFKGNWTCHLTHEATAEKILPDGGALRKEMRKDPDAFDPDEEEEKWCGFFSGLTIADSDGKQKQYVLVVKEDEVLDAMTTKTTYKAPTKETIPGGKKMESCSCIEGNPCADAYCCKDWRNRFEVAKKHGWKGFS